MKKLVSIVAAVALLPAVLLRAQAPDLPPVDACKPGDFVIMGYPNEFGPKTDSRFEVFIDKRFNGEFLTRNPIWLPVIEQAIEKWNGIPGATWEFRRIGLTDHDPGASDGKLTIAACGGLFPCPSGLPPSIPPGPEPPDFEPPPFGQLKAHQATIAVAIVTTEDDVDKAIADSDIFFNPALPLHTEPRGDQIDFESVLLHELGHALGLGHNDNCVVGPTIMESLIDLGEQRRSLQPAETEGVRFFYPDDTTAAVRLFDRDKELRFDAVEGGLPPFSKSISIFGKGGGAWTATAATSSGGNWLRLDHATGRFPLNGVLSVSVQTAALAAGDYEGTISINLEGHEGPPATVHVDLHVAQALPFQQQPFLTRQGIVSSANMTSAALAPGALFTLFGHFLAPASAEASSVPLPTRLGGTEVLINSVRAPLLFVSPTQINGQVPAELLPGRGGIIVRTGLGQTPPIPVDLAEAAPQLFIIGEGQALVLNFDGTVNTPENPAPQGSVISVFFSGQGPVSPPVATGRAAPASPLSRVVDFSSAQAGGQNAEILFLGLAPGFVGLAQGNIQLPAGLSGELPLQITIGETTSNIGSVSVE